jgi:hypothetical protein
VKPFSTIDFSVPAAISFITPVAGASIFDQVQRATTEPSAESLSEARIRSAFTGACRELSQYRKYSDSWDGYRAHPFSQTILASVASLLSRSQRLFLDAGVVPSLVTTGPASDGSIDVEFGLADKRVLMTLYPNESEIQLTTSEPGDTQEHVASLDENGLVACIAWLDRPSRVSGTVGQAVRHSR